MLDKIFSARLDEAALDEMERVTRRLKMTKRKFLEDAIHLRAKQLGGEGADVWSETLGAWKRDERAQTTIRRARSEFRRTFLRHHGGKRARIRR
jgi:hypothetical protein